MKKTKESLDVRLEEAFPKIVGDVSLSMDAAASDSRFRCYFHVQKMATTRRRIVLYQKELHKDCLTC